MPPKKSDKEKKPSSTKADEEKKDSKADAVDPDDGGKEDKPSSKSRKRVKPEEDGDDDGKKAEPRRSARQASQQKDKGDSEPSKKKAKTTGKAKPSSKSASKEAKSKTSGKKGTSSTKDKDAKRPPPGKRASQPDEAEHGSVASKDRLPKVGQTVFWRAMPGMVEGKVTEILKSDTTVGGKSVRASEEEPQLRLESSKSGKECVHKIDNIYFKDT